MPGNKELVDRTAVAVCLAVFLVAGLGDIVREDFPVSAWLWVGLFVYGLMLGVPLLVIGSRTIANLGVIRLMVCAGASIILAHYALDFLYGVDYGLRWRSMYSLLHTWMPSSPSEFMRLSDWIGGMIVPWIQQLDWVRLLTYGGLGYTVTRGKGLGPGIVACILVALTDHTLGWLVYLPDEPSFETPAVSLIIQYDRRAILSAISVHAGISATAGLVGAVIGWLDQWSLPAMSVARGRIHPVRRVPRHSR